MNAGSCSQSLRWLSLDPDRGDMPQSQLSHWQVLFGRDTDTPGRHEFGHGSSEVSSDSDVTCERHLPNVNPSRVQLLS